MKIQNHRLVASTGETPVQVKDSPNRGEVITPQYLVIHYTAGSSFSSSVAWLTNAQSSASAHLVIGLDGSIAQLVPFNRKAWHAGASQWGDLVGMNNHSIGIELDNPGRMRRVGSKWVSAFGREYPDSVVLQATHKHKDAPAGWHTFTEAQLNACVAASHLIVTRYGLKGILGHEDVSPFRKVDPGPAFPMESFRSKVLGRRDDLSDIFEVTTPDTNLRTGPGTQHEILGKLKKGDQVMFIQNQLNWFRVVLIDSAIQASEPEGWVHNSLLKKV